MRPLLRPRREIHHTDMGGSPSSTLGYVAHHKGGERSDIVQYVEADGPVLAKKDAHTVATEIFARRHERYQGRSGEKVGKMENHIPVEQDGRPVRGKVSLTMSGRR